VWTLNIFFPFWYVWTKKNLATLFQSPQVAASNKVLPVKARSQHDANLVRSLQVGDLECKSSDSWRKKRDLDPDIPGKGRTPKTTNNTLLYLKASAETGLPDFSWYNIPIWGKNYTKWPQNIPIGRKIYQHIPLQKPSKFTQIGILGFENIPSGNPVSVPFSGPRPTPQDRLHRVWIESFSSDLLCWPLEGHLPSCQRRIKTSARCMHAWIESINAVSVELCSEQRRDFELW
jgi:hypothetical protein